MLKLEKNSTLTMDTNLGNEKGVPESIIRKNALNELLRGFYGASIPPFFWTISKRPLKLPLLKNTPKDAPLWPKKLPLYMYKGKWRF